MSDQPLVSVIMPVRDREWCVGRAIDGVLAQTYPNFELIVVDDGSTDGTPAILEAYGPAIRVIRQPPAGAYAARDRGLAAARGELIAFADSDDCCLPDRLRLQVPLMGRPEVGLVFGDATIVREARHGALALRSTVFQHSPPKRRPAAGDFVWRNFVPTTTVLVRRACLQEIGGFADAGTLSADYLVWFRIALRHELAYVPEPVCIYTRHPQGISSDLGVSLAARIALFSDELAAAPDEAVRTNLRRLLFNLSLHMALAAVRGRAGKVINPMALALGTAWRMARLRAGVWAAGFIADQLWVRTRRAFA